MVYDNECTNCAVRVYPDFYVRKNGLKICKLKAKLQAYIKAKNMAL